METLIQSVDTNNDRLISAKDFKDWLFPASNKDDKLIFAEYLRSLVEEKFGGNIRELYEQFKR